MSHFQFPIVLNSKMQNDFLKAWILEISKKKMLDRNQRKCLLERSVQAKFSLQTNIVSQIVKLHDVVWFDIWCWSWLRGTGYWRDTGAGKAEKASLVWPFLVIVQKHPVY